MSERTKKILLVGGFILSVFVIAFILYTLFFKPTPPPASVEGGEDVSTGILPSAIDGLLRPPTQDQTGTGGTGLVAADDVARGGLTATVELTTSAVFNTVLSGDGAGMNYYNSSDARFYTIDKDGNVVALSDTQFPNAESVGWNKDSEKAVIEFPDGSNIVYDFSSEQQVTLPAHWEDFEFSPVKDEIIAKSIALDPNNRYLIISSDDGSSAKGIQALGSNAHKVEVAWSPNDQVVAFAKTAEAIQGGLDRVMIYPVGKNEENFKGLVVEGQDFTPLWSPNGKQLLYSVVGDYSNNKPLLWIVEATSATMGNDRHSLGLNTWADKCTWNSTTTIYCAVPLELRDYAGYQRSLFEDEPDALYKINLTTGKSNLVAIPAEATSMNNLQVSDDDALLYFLNDRGKLELMRLK